MKVNAIQGTDGTGTPNNTQAVNTGEDFASYMPATASLDEIFDEASKTYNVPKNLIKAIAKAESDFNPNATSRKGAQGIMQLMPGTAKELGVSDAYDPYQNIMGGTKYIGQILQSYHGDIKLALAAYNAGFDKVAKYGGVPPYEETRNFIAKITQYMDEGVNLPDAFYSVAGGIGKDGIAMAASLEEAEEGYYHDILERLFSYEDYLKFVDLYMKVQEAQEDKEKKEDQEQEQKSESYDAYKRLQYNPAVINLR